MDNGCNSIFFKQYGIRLSNDYFKIPIDIKENCYKYKTDAKLINITYIGRGNAVWKVKPVKKLIKDLSSVKNNFIIHIFTDTFDLFQSELKGLFSENVEVKYHFQYWGEKLSNKLIELSDLHYSMATSMLEGASLGIPTLIADAGMYDFPDNYKYRWFIDDVENYAGNFIDEKEVFDGYPIKEIVDQVLDKRWMETLSQKQHEYVCKNYSPSQIVSKITTWTPKARVRTLLKYHPSWWF
jgi:glycosyltransferase involved in cell wall biosynthesis